MLYNYSSTGLLENTAVGTVLSNYFIKVSDDDKVGALRGRGLDRVTITSLSVQTSKFGPYSQKAVSESPFDLSLEMINNYPERTAQLKLLQPLDYESIVSYKLGLQVKDDDKMVSPEGIF